MLWGEILGVMTWSLGSVGLPTSAISDNVDLEMRQMSMQNVSTVGETSILGLMTQTTYCNRQCLLDFPATSEQQDNVTNDIWNVNVECSNFNGETSILGVMTQSLGTVFVWLSCNIWATIQCDKQQMTFEM